MEFISLQDDHLTYKEFINFLHPERNERMIDVVVDETLEDIDLDDDGKISLKEYINDMYRDDPKHEPNWVDYERKQVEIIYLLFLLLEIMIIFIV